MKLMYSSQIVFTDVSSLWSNHNGRNGTTAAFLQFSPGPKVGPSFASVVTTFPFIVPYTHTHTHTHWRNTFLHSSLASESSLANPTENDHLVTLSDIPWIFHELQSARSLESIRPLWCSSTHLLHPSVWIRPTVSTHIGNCPERARDARINRRLLVPNVS